MKKPGNLIFIAIFLGALSFTAHSQDAEPVTLITNANVFDGVNEKLIEGADVLIEGNLIKQIANDIEAPSGATVIDADGKTLMPGLIDVHWHTYYAYAPVSTLATGDMSEVAIIGFLGAEKTLLRGCGSRIHS